MIEPEFRPRGLFIPLELLHEPRLSYHDKFLVVIVDMLDNDARHCFASNAFLASILNSSEPSVANGITRAKKAAWIEQVPNPGGERRLTTPLRVNREALEAVLKIEKVPSQNGEEAVLNFESVDNKVDVHELIVSSEEESPLSIFKQYFPDYSPNIFQVDQLESLVTNLDLWKKTCAFWRGNNYQGRHITRLIDCYNNGNALLKENGYQNGSPATVSNDLDSCPVCDNGMKEQCPYHNSYTELVKKSYNL